MKNCISSLILSREIASDDMKNTKLFCGLLVVGLTLSSCAPVFNPPMERSYSKRIQTYKNNRQDQFRPVRPDLQRRPAAAMVSGGPVSSGDFAFQDRGYPWWKNR